ncbi:hypothetical protein FB567DRAFT_189548 [Paraphoma chrysanthemicola]|uniref:Uncharacterized protein n=1 Tax=Paraphoma chrysanthemicola TaxID=798071 RepID=A0A8K0VU33_9PLEO|nr:hypothetical protein FB567DRAFT_189548 [Paraphoma chrysanthemicola]
MAGTPSNGKAAAKPLPPSQLRNEFRANSTDDESATSKAQVEAPDSQSAIPETQLEHQDVDGRGNLEPDHGGEPLSPRSSAVLEKYKTKKNVNNVDTSSLAVKLYAKNDFKPLSSSELAPSVGFSFGQPKKAPKKPSANGRSTLTSSAQGASSSRLLPTGPQGLTAEDSEARLSTPSITAASFVQRALPVVPHADIVVKDVKSTTADALGHPTHARKKHEKWSELHGSSAPPSAQPDPDYTALAPKNKPAKWSKRKNNGGSHHLRGGPLPPKYTSEGFIRPEHPLVPTLSRGDVLQVGTVTSFASREGANTNINQSEAAIELENRRDPTRSSEIYASPPAEEAAALAVQPRSNTADEAQATFSVAEKDQKNEINCDTTEAASEDVCAVPAEAPFLSIEQPVNGQNTSNLQHHENSHLLLKQHCHDSHAVSPTQMREAPTFPERTLQRKHGHFNKDDAEVSRTSTALSGHEGVDHAPSEALLHKVSDRNGSHRVSKSQKKRRPGNLSHSTLSAQVPDAIRSRPAIVGDSFEQALHCLRVAHVADQYRLNHDKSTEARHFEEIRAQLQIRLQHESAAVADWKERFHKLATTVSELQEKAKTNQKFVSGLQNDYEKLQKSAISSQKDCKKVLQQKIVELESEKEDLRRQWAITLDTIEKRQKSSKKTIDDLFVNLRVSQLKRGELTKKLDEQVEMLKKEKAKRSDLEKQLLASIQSVDRQLVERSTSIIESLASLQVSIEDSMVADERSSSIEECLTQLRQLRATPFLTSKDVQKAEAMLRFMQKDFDTRIDGLSTSIQGNVCSTQSLEGSIAEQLRKLRTEMMDFERITADNRQAQETTEVLQEQLLSEQKHKRQLQDKVQNLEESEKTLNACKLELEERLAGMDASSKRNESNTLALEQQLADLRQQLKGVGDERSSARAEIDHLEQRLQKSEQTFEELKVAELTRLACGVFR